MDKKNLPETNASNTYTEAKLVKSSENWYIEFWQGGSDSLKRYRPTFNINRIASKKERKKNAEDIIGQVNSMLEKGLTAAVLIAEIKKHSDKGRVKFAVDPYPLFHTPLHKAFNEMIEIKCQTDKKNSKKSYRHIASIFNDFIEKKRIASTPVSQMLKRDAFAFMDSITLKGGANTTFNNRLRDIRIIWNELKRREYTDNSPFDNIKYKKKSPKKRRNLTEHERISIAEYAKEHDLWLFRAIVMEYYLLIRPCELARLRFGDFNFEQGTVRLSEEITKNGKSAVLTIPAVALAYLLEGGDFTKYSTNYLVFGSKFVPNATKPVSENWLNYRHSVVLKALRGNDEIADSVILQDITGISFYSWKDTGITDLANDLTVGIFKASQQARHADTRTTLLYYHQSAITPEIRQWRKKLC